VASIRTLRESRSGPRSDIRGRPARRQTQCPADGVSDRLRNRPARARLGPRAYDRNVLVARGELAWLELEQEGRRPVVVLTRDEAIPRLRNIVVALVTRTIRGIDTEVQIGPADGMPVDCAISLDNLPTVPRSLLTEPITRLGAPRMDEICRALSRSVNC
jgi:mRNA interferase MazF